MKLLTKTILILLLISMKPAVFAQVSVSASSGISSATYPTLKDAFDAINIGDHLGVINISLTGSTIEPATAKLSESGGTSSYSSITITPSVACTVSGNLNAPLIELNGADNVVIDGRIGGVGSTRSLTVQNLSTTTNFSPTSTIHFINGASNNTIKYVIIEGSSGSSQSGTIKISHSNVTQTNSNNTIDNNEIRPAGSNLPIVAIYCGAGTGPANILNSITNNLIHDFYSPSGSSSSSEGIFINSPDNGYTITGNSIFQTTTITNPSTFITSFIQSAGRGNTISNNFIGGSAPNASGAPASYTASSSFGVIGILTFNSSENYDILENNLITNFLINSSVNVTFEGIRTSNKAKIGVNGGNTIGSLSGSTSIVVNCSGTSQSYIYGITAFGGAGTHDATVANNAIGSLTLTSAGTGNAAITGIEGGTHTGLTITNNIIGGSSGPLSLNAISGTMNGIELTTGTNNSVYSSTSNSIQNLVNNSTGTNASIHGFSFTFTTSNLTASVTVSQNQISNLSSTSSVAVIGTVQGVSFLQNGSLTNTINNGVISTNQISNLSSSSTGSSSTVRAIVNENPYSTSLSITGNSIHALSSPSSNSTASISASVQGIACTAPGTGAVNINGNVIHDLENTASANTHVMGISCFHGNNVNAASLLKNRIYDLRNPNATSSGDVTGILLRGFSGSGTFHVGNNMLSLYPDNVQVYGVTNNFTAGLVHLYYNSINITGTASGSNNSGAFNRIASSSSPVSFTSNIFQNLRTGGSGIHYSLLNSNASPATGWSSDYNDIYASNSNAIVLWGNLDMDFNTYQSTSSQDLHSKSVLANFTNTIVGDLHLSGASVMDQDLGGVYAGPDDFDGDPRPGRPYVGADQVALAPLPVTLEYFRGSQQGNRTLLVWKINCTSPSVLIEIEKSENGTNFMSITAISATQARCDLPFDFTDNHSSLGNNYYRLKMVESTGRITYSFIISILNNSGFAVIGLYPNLITDKARLSLYTPEKIDLKIMITDMQGKTVQSFQYKLNAGADSFNMSLSNLAAGVYHMTVTNGKGERRIIRFIKE